MDGCSYSHPSHKWKSVRWKMPVSKKRLLQNWRTCSKMKSNRWKTSSEIKQQHHKNLELLLKGHSWEFYWVTRYWKLPQDSVGTCRWWCELSEMHINYMSHNQDIEAYKTTLIMLGVHTELPCHTLSHNQGRKACKTSLNSFWGDTELSFFLLLYNERRAIYIFWPRIYKASISHLAKTVY